MRLSIALFLAILLFAVLVVASCDFRAISDETAFTPEHSSRENIADCDQVGHTWGMVKGDPYADSICTICGYCRHHSSIAADVYKTVDAKYHAFGDMCYACMELIDPVIEEHTFVDGYCDHCLQEAPAFMCTASREKEECAHQFPAFQETGNPYADSICVICGYCKHDSGISYDIYRIVDEKYHVHGNQCYACFQMIDSVIEEHRFVDGYCDDCLQEEP